MQPEDVALLIQRWLAEDFEAGHAGCDPTYPIYNNVREYLESEGLDSGLAYAKL